MLHAQLAVLCRAVEGPHSPEQVGVKRAEETNCSQRQIQSEQKEIYLHTKST